MPRKIRKKIESGKSKNERNKPGGQLDTVELLFL